MNETFGTALTLVKGLLRVVLFSFGIALIVVMIAAVAVPMWPGGEQGLTPETSRTVFRSSFVLSALAALAFNLIRGRGRSR